MRQRTDGGAYGNVSKRENGGMKVIRLNQDGEVESAEVTQREES